MAGNSNLHDSSRNKQDEFYTNLQLIEDELKHYRRCAEGGEFRADITIGDVYGLCYSNRWNGVIRRWVRDWRLALVPIGYFEHGTGVPQAGHDEQLKGVNPMNIKVAAAGMALSIAATCDCSGALSPYGDEMHPPADPRLFGHSERERSDPISDEEAVEALASILQYEHDLGMDANVFWRMGEDRERMTRVLLRSVEDARTRQYKHWERVAQCSIGSLSEYGTKTAIPFLESVLTNDVYGAGGNAANAYVRFAGDDGRDFEFFKRNFGVGKHVPRDVGKVIYRTLKNRLDGKGLPEEKRREYVDYLMSRAECEKDILTGHMLDKMLVEIVPGYKDSKKRKANLEIIAKPDPNQPHIVFRRKHGGGGARARQKEADRP